jgi:hypothetical protein
MAPMTAPSAGTAVSVFLLAYGAMLSFNDMNGSKDASPPPAPVVRQADEPWKPRGAARVVVQICNS